ncbi:MAG: sensor histidine kinase [Thermotogota bacterium]
MNKEDKYLDFIGLLIRLSLFFALFFSVYVEYKFFQAELIKNFILLGVLFLNDMVRYIKFRKHKFYLMMSLVISMGISYYLIVYVNYELFVYIFLTLYEITSYLKKKSFILFFFLHLSVYILIWFNVYYIPVSAESTNEKITIDLLTNIFVYLGVFFVIFLIKRINYERNKVMTLNQELVKTNTKLSRSLIEIEKLTITKERNRVAQEIHDSLGHSITGLIMHLDYLEKINQKKPEENEKVIKKCQGLSRNAMNDLRKAVFALKENEDMNSLNEAIKDLIDNLKNESINIVYRKQGEIEYLPPELKFITYRIVQEVITNSIKHGHANEIYLDIINDKKTKYFYIIESDNGEGSDDLITGNGLKGIENRIRVFNGELSIKTKKNMGFNIKIAIPNGGMEDDKSYVGG